MAEYLTQAELAKRLDVSTRWIRELRGMPREPQGYPWPECLHWFIEYQSDKKARINEETEEGSLELRKLEAEVRILEVKLAKEEGSVVSLDDLEKLLSAPLYRLRAKLLAMPSKWAPALVGCRTIAEAQARLEAAVEEAMRSLSEEGEEDPEDYADEAERAA
ncbi:MAG TPA: hypothetical protein VF167_09690 [Longimicrobiaceae bacterium]